MPYAINAQCNFSCTFCDRAWAREEVPDAQILREAPMSELSGLRAVLGGGEPTLHPRLPQLLSGLWDYGVRNIGLRTNAAWASRASAVAYIKKKGLRTASVLYPTDDPQLFDQLTGKKGAHAAVVAGLRNLQQARVRIILRIPVIQPTLADLPGLLRRIPHTVPGVQRIELVMLDIDDPSLQVDVDTLNRTLPHRSAHPDTSVPPLLLDPGTGIPLCWTDKMEGWNISPDCPTARRHHPAPCEGCFVKTACPGVNRGYAKVFGPEVVTPFELPTFGTQQRSTQSPVVMSNGALFEPVKGMTFECSEANGGKETLASVRLRVGHACNRRCQFCFIPHHEKAVQDFDIPASIQAAADAGAREVVMTGGEPTLVAKLPDYIRQARDLGVRRIILQTNAIRLSKVEFCKELADAGLTHVTVSLHSHRDDVLEKITGKGNTMQRIVQGMENTQRFGLKASITHVIGPHNYQYLPDFVKFMGKYVSGFCFIFATPMAWPMATKEIVVRYSDAAPYLKEALDWCIENDIVFDGLALKCGAPHCVVEGEQKYLGDAERIPEKNRTKDWIRVPACQKCVLKDQCYGVRRLYAWLYGVDEFQPVLEPGRVAKDWRTQLSAVPVAQTSAETLGVQSRVQAVAQALGYSPARTSQLLTPTHTHTFSADGLPAMRVRYAGPTGVSQGPIELSEAVDLSAARASALLNTLQAAIVQVPFGGAHGGVAVDPYTSPDAAVTSFVNGLARTTFEGTDILTEHVSSPWPPAVAAAQMLGDSRIVALPHDRSGLLRMTSVISAVAATLAAVDITGTASPILRYTVWGFGRAGQRYSELMDAEQVAGGQRPMMVGCCDTRRTTIDQRGLSHERMAAFKARNGKVPAAKGMVLGPGDLRFEPADVLLLSGRGPALDEDSAHLVRARVVVDMTGALTPAVEHILAAAGILVIPILLATVGPLVLTALRLESKVTPSQLQAEVRSRVARALHTALQLRDTHGWTMTDAVVATGLQQWSTWLPEPSHTDSSPGHRPESSPVCD